MPLPMTGIFSWQGQSAQYPRKDTPGIHYFKGLISPEDWVDCLLFYDKAGDLVGVLNHFPKDMPPYEKKGNISVFVKPNRLREGIATRLLKAALKRWRIDLRRQQYTPDGELFIRGFNRQRRSRKIG